MDVFLRFASKSPLLNPDKSLFLCFSLGYTNASLCEFFQKNLIVGRVLLSVTYIMLLTDYTNRHLANVIDSMI